MNYSNITTLSNNGNPVLKIELFEILEVHGYYRYVNHEYGLATTGFNKEDSLHVYADNFLATPDALITARARYTHIYGKRAAA